MTSWELYVGEAVRDAYEDLITSSKLRVVEEVEFLPSLSGRIHTCSSCEWWFAWQGKEDVHPMKYCPGCGNKIKR